MSFITSTPVPDRSARVTLAIPLLNRNRLVNAVATSLVWLCAAMAVGVLLIILAYVFIRGIPAINLAFFTERPLPYGEVGGGVAPAILGSLEMLAVAGLIGVPIGVGTAIYLSEYGRGAF